MNELNGLKNASDSARSAPAPNFRLLFESVPGLYLVLTTDFKIVAVSDAYLRATMTKRDEILGQLIFDVFPDNPDDSSATGVRNLRASLERVVRERVTDEMAVQKYDIRRPEAAGSGFEERYWNLANSPVHGPSREVAYIIQRVEDVTESVRRDQRTTDQGQVNQELRDRGREMKTEILLWEHESAERRRAEAQLRQGQERLQAVIDNMREGVVISDLDGQLFHWNRAALDMHGFTTSSEGNRQLREFTAILTLSTPGGQSVKFEDWPMSRLLRGEVVKNEEFTVRRLDIDWERALSYNGALVHDATGKRVAFLTVIDVTERNQKELAIRRSEKRFRLLVNGVKDHAIIMLDPAGNVQTWNSGAEHIFGYQAADIVGQNYARFFTPEDIASGKPQKRLVEAQEADNHDEGWRVRMDGSRYWANGSITAIYNEGDQLRGFVKISRDLTERKRSEALLQSVLNNTFDAIISIDEQGTILTFNLAAERIFGYPQAEVVGRNVHCLMPEPYHSQHDGYLARYLHTGQAKVIGVGREVEGRRKDGSTFPLELAVTEFRIEENGERHFIGVVRDISERRSAAEHQARLGAILEATPDFVGIADAQGRPIFINSAGKKMIGLEADEDVPETRISEYFPEWAATKVEKEGIPTAIKTGSWLGETALRTRAGGEMPVSQVIVAPKNANGEVRFLATIMRDLTEQKKLENQYRQAQKMEAVGQLAGGVAHDFNNLLTIISGYSELLLSRLKAEDPARQSVKAISEAGQRAASLTRQLLAFSRQAVLEPKVLDLNAVVREMERMLTRLIGEDVLLTAVLDPYLNRIKADPGHLDQVLMNLCVNARDAMPRGGRLTLETRNVVLDDQYANSRIEVRPGQYVMMAVTDTGCGMTPDVKARVFEPFYTTKGAGKGTGLGLAVVHGIIKQSSGHLEVYSEPNLGTTFKLYFPAVESQIIVAQGGSGSDNLRGTETVLLVEDEEGVRGLALLILQTRGYKVLEASGGNQALRLVERHQGAIDLLVTDVVMPGMGGQQLASALRSRFPHMKVLFTSGYTDDTVVRHGILEAEVEFLQKPYSPQSLAKKVREVLNRP